MKVRIKTNLGWYDYPKHRFFEGDVKDVEADVAEKMIARGHAESLESQPEVRAVPNEPMKAVPDEPTVKGKKNRKDDE